ncbi:MAG: hypothetical protein WCE68_11325 [Anaerolineales bacterium]
MKPTRLSPFLDKLLGIVITMMVIIGILLPVGSVKAAERVFGLPLPMPDNQAHITDGIIVLGCLIVVIIFTGVILGTRGTRKHQPNKPKRQ